MIRAIVFSLLTLVGASIALPAVAQNCDKPGAMCGGNKNGRGGTGAGGVKGTQVPTTDNATAPPATQYVIADKDRATIRTHFANFMATGACPPDLQKQGNACVATMTKTWAIGKVLPAGVVAHPLVDALLAKLSAPPNGYRYGRVSSDVLLLANSGNMVMDDVDFLAK